MIDMPMLSKGMLIPWEFSDEYINIDFSAGNKIEPIVTTIEWWRNEKRWVKYNVTSNIKALDAKLLVIRITYSQQMNQHLTPDDVCWGESIIKIDMDNLSGTAEWVDSNLGKNDGIVTWRRIDVPLVGEIKKEPITRILRNQAKFRAALLALDECCTITGENVKEVLEAAHIIPASSGGTEVIENGILLRADIHRLYDANFFSISRSGKIEVHEGIKAPYKDILENFQIGATTLKRVQRALAYVSQNPTKPAPNQMGRDGLCVSV